MNEKQYIEHEVQIRVLKEVTDSKFTLMQKNIDDKFIVDTLIVNNDFEMLEYFIVSGADVNLINDINIKNKIKF